MCGVHTLMPPEAWGQDVLQMWAKSLQKKGSESWKLWRRAWGIRRCLSEWEICDVTELAAF